MSLARSRSPLGQPSRTTPKSSKAKLIEKYDANKNGKLDADEIAALTNEQRPKAGERKPAGKKKKGV